MREAMGIRGKVTLRIGKPDGTEEISNHNIVTAQGDALIADLLSNSPTRIKVNNSNGLIQLGTGWTGNDTKNNEECNSPFAGGTLSLDAGFPQCKSGWGGQYDNVVVYQATVPAGSFSQNGIDEAALLNGEGGDCLAYCQVIPTVNLALTDSLQILWELSFTGS